MNFRKYFMFICVSGFLTLCSLSQVNPNLELSKTFIRYLNEGNYAEAEKMTTPDFTVDFKYSGGLKPKEYFFDHSRKNVNLKNFIAIDSIYSIDQKVILQGKEKTLLTQYLKLRQLPLRYTFAINENSISKLTIDSIKGFNDSLKINDRRWAYFERWSKMKHPDVNLYYLKIQYKDSLLHLAKEFYDSVVKK